MILKFIHNFIKLNKRLTLSILLIFFISSTSLITYNKFYKPQPSPDDPIISKLENNFSPQEHYAGASFEKYNFTDCKLCLGILILIHERCSIDVVEDFWIDLKNSNYQKDQTVFFELLKKHRLINQLRIAYVSQNQNEKEFKEKVSKYLKDTSKQIILFKNENEALTKLRSMTTKGKPAMILIQTKSITNKNEFEEDNYSIVYGYDKKSIYYWTPQNKWKYDLPSFLGLWNLEHKNLPSLFAPGNYNMVWLENNNKICFD